ncbi:MAG: CoA transferase, partial [bacterium]
FQAARWLMDGEVPPQAGNNHPTGTPTGVFRTRDGHVNIAASGQRMFKKLCHELGVPELVDDPRFEDRAERSRNRDLLHPLLEAPLAGQTCDEAVERLNRAGVPCGPILNIRQVFENEHVRAMGLAAKVKSDALGEIAIQNMPYQLSRTPGGVRRAAPERGEHTEEILGELGYSAAEIERMRGSEVV